MKAKVDKVDKKIRDRILRDNLIKWWNVKMIHKTGKEDEEEGIASVDEELLEAQAELDEEFANSPFASEIQDMETDEQQLLKLIMNRNDRSGVFQDAMDEINKSQIDEANEIYERLMREQAEDEARKQREIEEAKRNAMATGA